MGRRQQIDARGAVLAVLLVRAVIVLGVLALFVDDLLRFPPRTTELGCWLQARGRGSVDGQFADEVQLTERVGPAALLVIRSAQQLRAVRSAQTCESSADCPGDSPCSEGSCSVLRGDYELMQARKVDPAPELLLRVDSVSFNGRWGAPTALASTLSLGELLEAAGLSSEAEGVLALSWRARCLFTLFCWIEQSAEFFARPAQLTQPLPGSDEGKTVYTGLLVTADCAHVSLSPGLSAVAMPLFLTAAAFRLTDSAARLLRG